MGSGLQESKDNSLFMCIQAASLILAEAIMLSRPLRVAHWTQRLPQVRASKMLACISPTSIWCHEDSFLQWAPSRSALLALALQGTADHLFWYSFQPWPLHIDFHESDDMTAHVQAQAHIGMYEFCQVRQSQRPWSPFQLRTPDHPWLHAWLRILLIAINYFE